MANKTFVDINQKGVVNGDKYGQWANMKIGDVALPLVCPRMNDKSVHIFGTFGGASVALQATNDPALGNFYNAYDSSETDIVQTDNRAPWVILPNVYAIKPVITGGDGTTNLSIVIMGRGAK